MIHSENAKMTKKQQLSRLVIPRERCEAGQYRFRNSPSGRWPQSAVYSANIGSLVLLGRFAQSDRCPPTERLTYAGEPLCRLAPQTAAEKIRLRAKPAPNTIHWPGLRLGWLIDPLLKQVHIYRSIETPVVLSEPNSVSDEAVLPGFVLDLSRIFA